MGTAILDKNLETLRKNLINSAAPFRFLPPFCNQSHPNIAEGKGRA